MYLAPPGFARQAVCAAAKNNAHSAIHLDRVCFCQWKSTVVVMTSSFLHGLDDSLVAPGVSEAMLYCDC